MKLELSSNTMSGNDLFETNFIGALNKASNILFTFFYVCVSIKILVINDITILWTYSAYEIGE